MKLYFEICEIKICKRWLQSESGAQAHTVQTLTRLPGVHKFREAFGLRRFTAAFARLWFSFNRNQTTN